MWCCDLAEMEWPVNGTHCANTKQDFTHNAGDAVNRILNDTASGTVNWPVNSPITFIYYSHYDNLTARAKYASWPLSVSEQYLSTHISVAHAGIHYYIQLVMTLNTYRDK